VFFVFYLAVIQLRDFTNTDDLHSPAVEVLQYRERAGYFATSLDVRNERPLHLRYRIGQVVKHRTLGYKGVIVGWDLQAKVLNC
jgi:heat shock protein HspQ